MSFEKEARVACSKTGERLSEEGTWLTDNDVWGLCNLLAWQKRQTDSDIRIIDPLVLKRLVMGVVPPESGERSLFADPPRLLFLILNDDNTHWSVIILYSGEAYHCDSMYPYHSRYASSVMEKLDHLRLLTWRKITPVKSPRQRSGWECGIYTSLYCLVAMECARFRPSQEEFLVDLEKLLASDVNEAKRPEFTRVLLQLLQLIQ
jgi:hypothetical protein